jgi:membrane protease YdiL (CAAX protease family)
MLRRRRASLTGLAFALVLPAILSAGGPGELPADVSATRSIVLNEAVIWGLTLIVLGIVLIWERRPLGSIGLGWPTWPAIRAGLAFTALLLALAMVSAAIVQLSGLPTQDESQAQIIMSMPIWLQPLVAFSAGFTEEVLFRGYAIERMTELTGSRWLGAIIPIFMFGAVHAPFWGIGHAVVAGMTGLWLTLIYLWRRNLWTNIAAHAFLDGMVFAAMDIAAVSGTTTV